MKVSWREGFKDVGEGYTLINSTSVHQETRLDAHLSV
jgi:hypothetical protein